MIVLEQVTKSFGPHCVIDNIHLELGPSQTHILLGQSGCGKTTLLKIILGLIRADSGLVRINDLIVDPVVQKQIALQTGYVIQDGGLYPHMTAGENVTLVARMLKWSSPRIVDRLMELARLVGFDESILRRYPRTLSGGQRQRVGLMRALMLDPSLLVLDEPLGSLDPIVRSDLQRQLKDIFQSLKKTVLFVTHDIGEAAYFSDTITLMNNGQVVQHGPLADLLERPATPFVTQFIQAQIPPPELKLKT